MESEKVELKKELSSTWEFLKKNRSYLLILALILFNIFVRVQPYYLPITDEFAERSMENQFLPYARQSLMEQYPNLPASQLEETAQQELAKMKASAEWAPTKAQVSQQFKDALRNPQGHTYLFELDPFHWMRYAQNIVKTGHPEDVEKDGVDYDLFMLAPNGRAQGSADFHPYLIAYWHKLWSLFGVTDMMFSEFFIPVLLTCLAIIPAFLICKRIGGDIAGIVAGLLIVLNKAFLSRTVAGFSDTDSYAVLMPLLIVWLIIEAYYCTSKMRYIYSFLSALMMSVFAWAWIGWSYMFDMVVASFVLFNIFLYYKEKKFDKPFLITQGVWFVSSYLLIWFFRGFAAVSTGLLAPIHFINLKQVAVVKIWPNVLTTVAEQNEINFSTLINHLGGIVFFIAAFIGLFYLFRKKKWYEAVLISLVTMATLFASLKGARYIQLLLPMFALLAGLGFYEAIEYLKTLAEEQLKLKKVYTVIICLALIFVLFIKPYREAEYTAYNEIPLINDAWYDTLTKINLEASQNAIIASWWDYGHWFKTIGNRPVIFDGASQDTNRAHWIGKALLTSNEDESVAILKMLVCGGDNAYNKLREQVGDDLEAKLQLDQMLLNKSLIPADLKQDIDCDNPPELYFITSSDMVGKGGVWGHFGAWDFEKAQAYQDFKKGTYDGEWYGEMSYLYTSGDVDSWISPWPGFMTSEGPCMQKDELTYCENNIGNDVQMLFNKTSGQFLMTPLPDSYIYQDNETIRYVKTNETNGLSIILTPRGSNIVCSPLTADSIFTRAFFFEGKDLEHFGLFDKQTSFMGEYIYVWRLKW